MTALLGLALAAALSLPADAESLVRQLGSPRFQEREAAAESLRGLGRDALAALRTGTKSDDPEIRTRASAILAEVEGRLMLEPTLITLAFRDRPLQEVLQAIGEEAGLDLAVVGADAAARNAQRISLESADRVPLWEAIDRLGRASGLQLAGTPMAMMMGNDQPNNARRRPTLTLVPAPGSPAPAAHSGPFRLSALNVYVNKDRNFQPQAAVFAQMPNPVLRRGLPGRIVPVAPQAAPVASPGASTVVFAVGLQLASEPRMALMQNGNYRLLEAVDESGRSLQPAAGGANAMQLQAFGGFNAFGGGNLQFQAPLQLPENPGTLIKTLRVAVPVIVMTRKDEPFEIVLAEAKGKTFEHGDMTLQIHDVVNDPNQPFTTIELTVKMRRDEDPNPAAGPFGPEFMAFRFNPGQPQNQVEILDAQGRAYSQWFPFSPQPGNDGLRIGLRLMPAEGVGPPARIRLYDVGRAETEVTFELHDIPMP
jgi:hypothetical protein